MRLKFLPLRVVLCFTIGIQAVAAADADTLFTKPIQSFDFLAGRITRVLPAPVIQGLNLVGWQATSYADSIIAGDTTLVDSLYLSPDQARDILWRGGNFLTVTINDHVSSFEIDSTGQVLSFYELHDGENLRLPTTVSMDWYYSNRLKYDFDIAIKDALSKSLVLAKEAAAARGGNIKVFEEQIAGQQVLLSIGGNVNVTGSMAYLEQQKAVASLRDNQNWNPQIDQKQRFDIEGNIGDRISVFIHQDSENLFEWQNAMKIKYTGAEDDILQSVEAGNISLSLPGTGFALGGSGKSSGLFGVKALSQLGPVTITTIASIEESKKITKSGALGGEFIISDQYYLQNKYFFLDMTFRERYYPLDDFGNHTYFSTRIVGRLEVYRSSDQNADTYYGAALIDPDTTLFDKNNSSTYPENSAVGHWQRLEQGVDYNFDPQLGWIRLRTPAMDRDIIAVAYTLGSQVGDSIDVYETHGAVGFTSDLGYDIYLKLIKARSHNEGSPTWPLEFKNVYSMGGSTRPEGFELKILDRRGKTEADETAPNGDNFLTIFGLDKQDKLGNNIPDGEVDRDIPSILNFDAGEIHFPALMPFAYSDPERDGALRGLTTHHDGLRDIYIEMEDRDGDFRFDRYINGVEYDSSITGSALEPDGDRLDEHIPGDFNTSAFDVPAIYYKPKDMNAKNNESRFDIAIVKSNEGQTVFNLGFNLLEGSETVKLPDRTLVRNVDYKIDYMTGTLTLLKTDEIDPSLLTIDYEENVLISIDKKVLIGSRAQMDLGPNSFIGITGLYYNQSSIEERVDVGREPIQNFLWDINGQFGRPIPGISKMLNRLSFINSDRESEFLLEGEIAQVRPNPNPLDQAYIDDFEASKQTTSPTLKFSAWEMSSLPLGKKPYHRRRMAWWNPEREVPVKSIWPNRETSALANNITTTILKIDAFFAKGYDSALSDDYWAGITYPMSAGEYDMSRKKFFEIWVKGDIGVIHIDLGVISEDINGNGIVDTEDKPESGLRDGNGVLEDEEDVGLDGVPSILEDGMGGGIGIDDDGDGRIDEDTELDAVDYYQGLKEDGYIYDGPLVSWANPDDPNEDDFNNNETDGRRDWINGMEGNKQSVDGNYPDSEDINRTGVSFVDSQNKYYTLSFNLEEGHPDEKYIGGRTFIEGGSQAPTGWKMYRLPLIEFVAAENSDPNWNDIQSLRIWYDGLGNGSLISDIAGRVEIAKIELVGNQWEETGIADVNSEEYVLSDIGNRMAVTVSNTEDNDDYVTPPGVDREYDRRNDVRLREQSLVLDFSEMGIPVGKKAAASKTVLGQESTFLVYRQMEMFVYGESDDGSMTSEKSDVLFWFRMGHGEAQNEMYYEVRKPIYLGWDKRNNLVIDMDALAKLKLRDEADRYIYVDGDTIPGYDLDDMEVYIKGAPSLERLDKYTTGVINTSESLTIHGKLMLDELRLSHVKRDPGTALRLAGSMNLGDLAMTKITYKKQDANFHTIQNRIARNAMTDERLNATLLLSPDRFLPADWRVTIPINVTYTNALRSPKYFPGSDIVTGKVKDAPDSLKALIEATQNRTESLKITTRYAKDSRSDNWFLRQTFDRVKGGVTVTKTLNSTNQIFSNQNTKMSGNISYPIRFPTNAFFKPFEKIEKLPFLGNKLKDMKLYYAPISINLTGNINEGVKDLINRNDPDSTISTYNLTLIRKLITKYKITDRITADYMLDIESVLDQYRYEKLNALTELQTGLPRRLSETMSLKWDPALFSWFKPKFAYQSKYSWRKVGAIDSVNRGGQILNEGRSTAAVTLELRKLVETIYKPEKKTTRTARPRRRRGAPASQEPVKEEAPAKEIENKKVKAFLGKVHTFASKFNPINFSYAYGKGSGEPAVIGDPNLAYRFGFQSASGLVADTSRIGTVNLLSTNEVRDISWRSGLNLSRSVNINFSHSRKWTSKVGNNSSSTTHTMDFLVLNDSPSVGIPFASWSVKISNMEKLPILNRIPWKLEMDHSFSGNRVKGVQNNDIVTTTYKRQFQPLLGIAMTFDNGITGSIRASNNLTFTRTDGGDSKNTTDQVSATFSYRRKGGMNVKIPFFRDFNLSNTINFSLDISYNKNVIELRKDLESEYAKSRFSKGYSVEPYITYTFTNKVTGSIRYTYSWKEENIIGVRQENKLGFDVNIAIKGN